MLRIAVLIFSISFAHEQFFEGKVTYTLKSFDQNGKPLYSPIQLFETYYSKTKKITSVLSGDFKLMVGDYYLYVDTDRKTRFEVWESQKKIVELGIEAKRNIYYEVSKTDLTETILGYKCANYSIKRKYDSETDTTYFDVFATDEIRIPSTQIVEVIGNSSTDNLDGSISGLPLKITIRNSKGTIEQKATDVRRGKLIASLDVYLSDLKVSENH